jgi:hypothetical protein
MNCSKYLLSIACIIAYNNVKAQVPVIKEPHHKPVLVNEYVRLLDVHLNPGDTTQYHIHAAPSVIVEISHSTIGIQIKDAAPGKPAETLPGTTNFIAYDKKPVTHRVFNAGDNVFHVMDIELAKKEPSADSCNAIQQANVQTTINEKLVHVYKLGLNQSQSLSVPKSSCAHLLICITGKVTAGKKIGTGEYIFFKPNTDISINNNDNTENSTCVLLELK